MIDITSYFQNHPTLFLIYIGFISLCVGSFLNVVIYRLPLMLHKEWHSQCTEFLNLTAPDKQEVFNLVQPRSRCPHCQTQIRIKDNIPLLSYLLLKGKCAHCQQPISLRYPLLEVACAILSLIVAWHYGPGLTVVAALIFTWSLLCLTVIDIDHQLLPDNITQPILWLGLLVNLLGLFADSRDAIIGAIFGYVSLWLVAKIFHKLTGRVGMGNGDFKLLAMLGAWTGWQLLPFIIFVSSLLGSLLGLVAIFAKKHDKNIPIPFGPYLAIAGWIALLWGHQANHTYLQFIY